MSKAMSMLGWVGIGILLVIVAILYEKQSWLWYGGAVLVALAAAFYLCVPWLIWHMMSVDIEVPAEDIDPSQLLDDIADYFDHTGRSLETLGFVDIGTFRLDGMMPNLASGFRLMAHPEQDTLGMIAFIQPMGPGEPQPAKYHTEFATDLTDGRNLNTNDSSDVGSPDQNPSKIVYSFPGLDDLPLMWEIHCGMVNIEARGVPRRKIPWDTPPAQLLHDEFYNDFEKKVQRGYWKRGSHEGLYRLTMKGAYASTWAELPPLKGWRRARSDRRSAALRKRLGL